MNDVTKTKPLNVTEIVVLVRMICHQYKKAKCYENQFNNIIHNKATFGIIMSAKKINIVTYS